MYISKIMLNPVSYEVQKEIGNPYQLHRTIMKAFPDKIKEKDRDGRILFRIEKNRNNQYSFVLVQSFLHPDWKNLTKRNNFLIKDPDFKEFHFPPFRQGNIFWFRLFANPTKKIDGKRIGFYKEEDQYNWLQRRAELSGFQILQVNIVRKEEIKTKANKELPRMTFYGVRFEGALRVEAPQKFKYALKNGIGSGKAFGFGLLTIAKMK